MVLGYGLNTGGGWGDKLSNPLTKELGGELRGNDFQAGFVIQELNPEDALKPFDDRRINLVGNLMPKIPFETSGEQYISKKYYPGNPEAAVQILGPRESDVIIRGRFYAKRYPKPEKSFLAGLPAVGSFFDDATSSDSADRYTLPYQLSKALDEMRQRGNPVKITLGEWERYAVITNTVWRMKKLGDIDYEITFAIISIKEPTKAPIIDEVPVFPPVELTALNEQLTGLQADIAARRIPGSVPIGLSDLLNDITGTIAGVVSGVIDFANSIIDQAEDISDSMQRAIGVVKYAEAEVSRGRGRLAQLSYAVETAGFDLEDDQRPAALLGLPNDIPTTDRYQTSWDISKAIGYSNDFSNFLRQLREKFTRYTESEPLARHLTKGEENLQNISLRWYGTADNWKNIYDHNKLTSTVLDRGRILEIPKL